MNDILNVGTGINHYVPVNDVISNEKLNLMKLFRYFNGYAWSKNFGWIGQPKLVQKPLEIKPFESSAELWDGINTQTVTVHNSNDTTSTVVAVKDISFVNFGCVGKLKDCIGEFPHMKSLSIDNNAVTGHLPHNIKNLRSLEKLSMHSNLISGDLV